MFVLSEVKEFVIKAQVLAGGRGKGVFDTGFKGGVHLTKEWVELSSFRKIIFPFCFPSYYQFTITVAPLGRKFRPIPWIRSISDFVFLTNSVQSVYSL